VVTCSNYRRCDAGDDLVRWAGRKATCCRAFDAAVEASVKVKICNLERKAAHLRFADVDNALHIGEVLYGNVGAVARLDFTVIGNEVVRMEKPCEPLGQQILFSSRFANTAGRCDGLLESLGHFQLRGVDEAKEIFGLRLSQTVAVQRKEA
jgi:adenylate cyclase